MSEGDCLISPFFESASNILLDSLFREDRPPTDFQLGNSVNNDIDLFDNYEGHLTRSISIPNEQGNSDSLLPHYDTPYSYGMNYQNRSREPPSYEFDDLSFPNTGTVDYTGVSIPSPTQNSIAIAKNHPKSKVDSTMRRNRIIGVILSFEHNISEKRRIERINNCINELYHLLELSGVCIRKSKVTILSETIKKILYLEQAIKELKQKVRDVEITAQKVMKEPYYYSIRSSVNYHVMFLQHPTPQAILSADGQFIDANSQFCSLTQKTVEQLRAMTLFKFAAVDDLPCAFSSYSNILRTDNNTNGVCMFRHCYLSDCVQTMFFSLSVVRNEHNVPINFICTILPVFACSCTDSNKNSRICSGQLRGKNGKLYQICNPILLLPWCAQLVDSLGTPIL